MKHPPSPARDDHMETIKDKLKDALALHILKNSYV